MTSALLCMLLGVGLYALMSPAVIAWFVSSYPSGVGKLSEHERMYLALFLAAKHLLDYRVAAAMHVYAMRNRVALRPELLTRTFREAKVVSKIPRAVEEDSAYAWEAVLYKGIVYAEQILGSRQAGYRQGGAPEG